MATATKARIFVPGRSVVEVEPGLRLADVASAHAREAGIRFYLLAAHRNGSVKILDPVRDRDVVIEEHTDYELRPYDVAGGHRAYCQSLSRRDPSAGGGPSAPCASH